MTIRQVGSLLLLLLLPGSVAEAESARFRLLSAENGERLERRLRSAAEDGFRLLEAAQGVGVDGRPRIVALMERSGEGASYEYRTMTCSGTLKHDATRERLAELGSQGFRLDRRSIVARKLKDFWLPDAAYEEQMVLILERGADRRPWVYDAISFGEHEPFYRDLAERRREGFQVVGMWNSFRALQVLLRKPADGPPNHEVPDHRLLLMATRTELRVKLEFGSGAGFRIMAAEDPSVVGPPILLMERTAGPGDAVDYKFVDDLPERTRKDKLEKKLNKRARKGFRVVREGMTGEVILMAGPAKRDPTRAPAHYRILSSRRAPGLPVALERAVNQGYEIVRLFVEPDETTVLVERIEPAEAR